MLANRNPDDEPVGNTLHSLPTNDGPSVDGYVGEDIIIPHNELRQSEPFKLVPVNIDVPVKGFNVLLGFNVHLKSFLGIFKRVVGTGGELSVRAFRENEVNVGLHNLYPFSLLIYKNYAKVGLFIEKYCDKMRNLRLYNTDAAFKAHEQAAGGDGNATVTVVPGVSMSSDQRKRYFNPHDKNILVYEVSVKHVELNTLAEIKNPETIKFKGVSGTGLEISTNAMYGQVCGFNPASHEAMLIYSGGDIVLKYLPELEDSTILVLNVSAATAITYLRNGINYLKQNLSSILVDGTECSLNTTNYTFNQGIHVVVFKYTGDTVVDSRSFNSVTALQAVFFSKKTKYIDSSIFDSRMEKLNAIMIPESVTGISSDAFGKNPSVLAKNSFVNNSQLNEIENNYWGLMVVDSVLENGLIICGSRVIGLDSGSGYENIIIPNGITEIANSAFSKSNITAITIPDSVTGIGTCCFYGCSGLTSITIPNNVTSLGNNCFYGCSGLTNVTIGTGVTSLGGSCFQGCSGLTSITIPNSVTGIGTYCFYNCRSLTSITIPNNVTSLSDYCFYGCSGLTSITIPNNVKSLGGSCFYACSGLTSITIGTGVTGIGSSCFYNCRSLTSITIPDSVTSWGGSCFLGCSSLTSATIGAGVTSVGDSCFYNCSSLTNITIPDNVKSLGTNCFQGCSSLTSATIGTGVTSLSSSAFCSCSNLETVSLGNNITGIGNYSFYRCYNLKNITIPNTVKSIGTASFINCESIVDINIPNGVTTIGASAFTSCTGIKNITIPNSVTAMGACCFYSAASLTSATINGNNLTISSSGFAYCKELSYVYLSDGVKKLNSYAFYNDSEIEEITIPDSVTSLGEYCFGWCSKLNRVNIGTGITAFPAYCFSHTGFKEITVPENVTNIGTYCFCGCTSLNSVYLNQTITSLTSATNCFTSCSNLARIVAKRSTAPAVAASTFNGVPQGGTLYYPAGSNYSSWLSTQSTYLGYYGWSGSTKAIS